jgi:uncharacterized membrane protein
MTKEQFLKDFSQELNKHFYKDEATEILDYYEEIINERLASNEDIDDILAEYNQKEIIKDLIPNVLIKRDNNTLSRLSKSLKQLIIILISTPLFIPLGILIIVLIVLSISLIISLAATIVSGFIFLLGLIVEMINTPISLSSTLTLLGVSLSMFSLLVIGSIWIYQLIIYLSKKILNWSSKLLQRKGENS